MFTTKPESGEKITKLGGGADAKTPFTEPPATYASRSPDPTSSKMAPSIIGEDLTIRGNVTSKGEIQIDGEIEGDIRCGSLLLGDKSKVTGGVAAEDVVVRGHIVGSITGVRVTLQGQCGDQDCKDLKALKVCDGDLSCTGSSSSSWVCSCKYKAPQ